MCSQTANQPTQPPKPNPKNHCESIIINVYSKIMLVSENYYIYLQVNWYCLSPSWIAANLWFLGPTKFFFQVVCLKYITLFTQVNRACFGLEQIFYKQLKMNGKKKFRSSDFGSIEILTWCVSIEYYYWSQIITYLPSLTN